MTPRRFSPLAMTAVVAAALVMFPAAGAATVTTGSVVAQSMSSLGPATFTGHAGFVHLSDLAGSATRIQLSIEAAKVTAYVYQDEYKEAAAAGFRQGTSGLASTAGQNPPQRHEVSQASLTTVAVLPDYVVDAFGTGSLAHTGTASNLHQKAVFAPYLTESGIREAPNPADPDSGGSDAVFTHKRSNVPQVLSQATATDFKVTGDFVLELHGVSTKLVGREGTYHLQSGRTVAPAAPGAPDNLRDVRDHFVRLVVTGGTLTANVTAADRIQWTDVDVATTASGAVLEGASGAVTLQDGTIKSVSVEDLVLDGRSRLATSVSENGATFGVTGLDANGEPRAVASASTQLPTELVLGLTAVFLAVCACAAAILLVLRRRPTMADVEAALEAGHYRAAARSAGAILRRTPASEDALISRAVALSKAGRPAVVVAEVGAHLKGRSPSDGVLHYVLGLAYLDLGQTEAGSQALREAVRRTPSLAAQVGARLGTEAPPATHERDSPAYT